MILHKYSFIVGLILIILLVTATYFIGERTRHIEKYTIKCAVLSSIDAATECNKCLTRGDYWIAPLGCVSKSSPEVVCKDLANYDQAKECLTCVNAGSSWVSSQCD